MKKLLLALVFLVVSLNAGELMIKRDGAKYALSFEKKDGLYVLSNQKRFDDKVKVIITYKDDKYKDGIESKYNLLNGKDKYGMYFIYEQNADDVIELFAKLSEEKNNIQVVHPNWTMSTKKY